MTQDNSPKKIANPRKKKQEKITQIDPTLEVNFQKVAINWVPAIVLLSTPLLALILVPWYGFTHGYSVATYVVLAVFAVWSGLGITAGYHRLWSHKTYEANVVVRFVLLVGATMAVQNSVFEWCAGHRIHHGHVDDVYKDPYSSKRGFWFSHMGWMLKKFPSGEYDFKKIRDLTADPMLQAQHKHYNLFVIITNVILPMAIGYMIGDVWGTLILAGLGRLVVSHHSTFFINSLAHMWGSQPYTDKNTAKDNAVLAFFTWGEGYHNYHHIFQHDYRNGVKWWHYDPTKWLIYGLSTVRLTSKLRTIPNIKIQQAKLDMQFQRAQNCIESNSLYESMDKFKERVTLEHELFSKTLEDWTNAKKLAMQNKIAEKKAYALLEKEILEAKFNEKLEQKKDSLEQAKANIDQAKKQMQNSLNNKLSEIDKKLQLDKKAIEQRMINQYKQLCKVTDNIHNEVKSLGIQ